MDQSTSIVDKIRMLARAQGMSLTTLEMKLNMGNGTISRWTKSSPNTDKLMRVADFFHVPMDYLLGRELSSYDNEFGSALLQIQKPVSVSAKSEIKDSSCFSSEDFAAIYCATKGMRPVPLSSAEYELINKYRSLDDRGQSAVLNVLDHEYESRTGENTVSTPKEA